MEKKQETAKKEHELIVAGYLIRLIRAVLNGTVPERKPETVTMKQLFGAARKHNLECIAYDGAIQVAEEKDREVMEHWAKQSRIVALQGIMQEEEGKMLFQKLPEEGIRVLPMKGYILKSIYPRPEYRQMVDLDILIDCENREKAGYVMQKLGYQFEGSDSDDTVDHYQKKPWINVELHTYMIPFQYKSHEKYRNIWEKCKQSEQIYSMNWDDYYVFMIEHFAKHFYYSGSGIRFLVDIYIFLEQKAGFLDQKYLQQQFQERGLEEFRKKMEKMAYNWFGREYAVGKSLEEKTIMLSSVFGSMEQFYENMQNKAEKECAISWLMPVIYIRKRVFLGYHEMCGAYPYLRKYPFLLPLTWILRIVKGIHGKRKEIKKELGFLRERRKQDA